MDVNTFRILVTLVSFGVFVAIVAWAWSRRNRSRFDEAARLPLEDEAPPAPLAAPTPSPDGPEPR